MESGHGFSCAKHWNGMENNPPGLSGTAFKTFNCFLGYIAAEITNDIIDYWESTESSILHILQEHKV